MPINTIEYAQVLQSKLDQQAIRGATSGWMEDNAGQVIYNGGNEVKIPTISTQGLGKYDRDAGFVQGSVTLKHKTYQMTQDRGRTFQIDAMDVDETNFALSATNVAKEFQDRHVIPEIDAYRYSRIAAIAKAKNRSENYTPLADTILAKLRDNIRQITDVTSEPLVITMASGVLAILEDSPKWQKMVSVADFKRGELTFKVKMIDDCPIISVPQVRMKSVYEFLDGKTSSQEAGGFKPGSAAKDINWIITAQKAPIAVSKTDKVRVFTPDVNQKADAWKIDFRKYHDLWIPEERLATVFVSIQP